MVQFNREQGREGESVTKATAVNLPEGKMWSLIYEPVPVCLSEQPEIIKMKAQKTSDKTYCILYIHTYICINIY